MEYPSRVWEISRYIDENGKDCSYEDGMALWASREPTDDDRIRRRLAKCESDKRLHELRERLSVKNRELRREG